MRFLLFLALAVMASSAEPERFVQDRFAIGLWVPPQGRTNLTARYREIRDANFNLVIGSGGAPVREQLRVCERFGLRALVDPGHNDRTSPDGPACWGYLLADEPGAGAFAGLAGRVAAFRRLRPGRLAYINLFPNYATAEQLGTPDYGEHLRRFVAEVRPDVLSMDHYPNMRPDADTRDAYLENLESMRRASVAAGIPFWNFFHSMPYADHLDPTEAQIRWMIHASIAHGAKGVMYFCYWTPGKGAGGAGEFPKGGAILTAEGLRTRHYDEARRINAGLLKLGPTLMELTPSGVVRFTTGSDTNALRGTGVIGLERVGTDPQSTLLVGAFRHADGRRGVMLVNHSHAFTAWPTVVFDSVGPVTEVSRADGQEHEVVDDSPELPGTQLSLGAGDGRLFLLPPAGR
jgi:Beta-galactosidase